MDWETKPQPVGESRWRFPLPSELPAGDLRERRRRSCSLRRWSHAYRRGHLPDGSDRDAGGDRLVVAGPAGHPAARRAARHAVDAAELQEVRDSRRHLFCARHPRAAPIHRAKTAGSAKTVITAYTRLHELGWAHSVEVFDRAGELAGGLYGVRVDGLFAGESMFHRRARRVESGADGARGHDAEARHAVARRPVVHGAPGVARRGRHCARGIPRAPGGRCGLTDVARAFQARVETPEGPLRRGLPALRVFVASVSVDLDADPELLVLVADELDHLLVRP